MSVQGNSTGKGQIASVVVGEKVQSGDQAFADFSWQVEGEIDTAGVGSSSDGIASVEVAKQTAEVDGYFTVEASFSACNATSQVEISPLSFLLDSFETADDSLWTAREAFGGTLTAQEMDFAAEVKDRFQAGSLNAIAEDLTDLDQFRVDARFSHYTGKGYTVVILDSGIDSDHEAFGADVNEDGIADRILHMQDFSRETHTSAEDMHGHGTHVASIIGSEASQYLGIAPDVNIVMLQALNTGPYGGGSGIEEALQWVVEHAEEYNIVALNMSIGSGNVTSAQTHYQMGDEYKAIADLGILSTISAGNSYSTYQNEGVNHLASDPNVLPVGAVYSSNISYPGGTPDNIVYFSQRSSEIDMTFAPGAFVYSAKMGGGVVGKAGTSMASPYVSGMVVLAQQMAEDLLGRRLGVQELKELIVTTGDTITDIEIAQDNADNTLKDYSRVNMLSIAEAIWELAGEPRTSAPNDDYAENATTSALITSGNFSGRFETAGDADWVGLDVIEGVEYNFTVNMANGSSYSGVGLAGADGATISLARDGISYSFTADASERVYIRLYDLLNAGTYQIGISDDQQPVNAAPVVAELTRTFAENTAAKRVELFADAVSDSDSTSLSITAYSVGGQFTSNMVSVNLATGRVTVTGVFDYLRAGQTLAGRVDYSVSDGTSVTSGTLNIVIAGENDAISLTCASAYEVEDGETLVATLTASDADIGDACTFRISGGADASLFAVNATTGRLAFRDAANFAEATDANGDGIYDVVVAASDGETEDSQAISVTVAGTTEYAIRVKDTSEPEGALGKTHQVQFVISRAGDISAEAVVSVVAFGTALAGTDYADGLPASVTIAAGEASAILRVTVKGNNLVQDHRTLGIRITEVDQSRSVITTSEAQHLIVDDDHAPVAMDDVFEFAFEDVFVDRSGLIGSGTVTLDVLANDTDADGNPIAIASVTAGEGVLSVAISAGRIQLELDPDAYAAGGFVTFSYKTRDSAGNVSDVSADVDVNIDAIQSRSFAIRDTRIIEGNSGEKAMRFLVTRSGEGVGELADSIEFETTAGSIEASGSVDFAPGQKMAWVTIMVPGDRIVETHEQIEVTIRAVGDYYSNPAALPDFGDAVAIGTVLDNDRIARASLSPVTRLFQNVNDAQEVNLQSLMVGTGVDDGTRTRDIVLDFTPGTDFLHLANGARITSFHTMSSGAVITFDGQDGDSIYLRSDGIDSLYDVFGDLG